VLDIPKARYSEGSIVCLNIAIWFANLLNKEHIKYGVTVSVGVRVRLRYRVSF